MTADTDIVDRLRNHTFQAWPLRTEAAEEIERLRFLLKEGLDNGYFDYEMQTAQDWIERVTTAIRGPDLTDEIERLRAENKVWTDLFAKHDDRVSKVRKAVKAERERCAKIAETTEREGFGGGAYNEAGRDIAAAIRKQP